MNVRGRYCLAQQLFPGLVQIFEQPTSVDCGIFQNQAHENYFYLSRLFCAKNLNKSFINLRPEANELIEKPTFRNLCGFKGDFQEKGIGPLVPGLEIF